MVDFAAWNKCLNAITEDESTKLFTLLPEWRLAAIDILSKQCEPYDYFQLRPVVTSGEIITETRRRPDVKHDKSSKKKSTSDDLDEMRKAFRRHNERAKGGGGGGKEWDKLGDGKNLRRVLPRPGDRKFYTEAWIHFNVGPNDKALRCVDEEHINLDKGLPESGTKCPLCKKFLREQARINSEYEKGDDDGRAEWKRAKDKWTPRHQYYINVLREDDGGDFEVKVLPHGPQVWGQLMNYYLGDDTTVGDFTSIEEGRWMNIKKEKKGGQSKRNVEYKVFPSGDAQDISDAWDTIKEALHDLDAAAGKVMSIEEVTAIMKGVDADKESGDDDDDDDDDDEASDRSSRKKRRSRDDDDAGSDGGSGGGDDDEDDRPVKKSTSKLAGKMKKNRRDD